MKKLIEKCNRLGIYCFGCFMIGFPEETPSRSVRRKTSSLRRGLITPRFPLPNRWSGQSFMTCITVWVSAKGVDERASTYFHTKYDTVHFKAEELNEMRGELLRAFARQRIRNIFRPGGLSAMYCRARVAGEYRYFLKVGWLALRGY